MIGCEFKLKVLRGIAFRKGLPSDRKIELIKEVLG